MTSHTMDSRKRPLSPQSHSRSTRRRIGSNDINDVDGFIDHNSLNHINNNIANNDGNHRNSSFFNSDIHNKHANKFRNGIHTEFFLDKKDLPPFRPGAIKRISLKNFMTYDDVELLPGPGLNLVLGPNGTGKSSIVSAICVGLGGNPKLLGRASKVRDYVKQGKEKACIDIDLCSTKGKTINIKRIFNKSSNSSTWKLNGQAASVTEVENVISSFNIQLDNLTQFLPQDKVASFAAMGAIELLQSTQKAVLPPEVIEKQEKLIETQAKYLQFSSTVTNLRHRISQLKKQNEAIEKEVQRLKEREVHLDRAERLKIRELFIQFSTKQAEARLLQEEKQQLQKRLEEMDRQLAPQETTLRNIMENLTSLKKEEERVNTKIFMKKEEIKKLNQHLESLGNGYAQAKAGLDRVGEREEDRQRQKKKYQQTIVNLKQKFIDTEEANKKEEKDAKLGTKENALLEEVRLLEDQKNELDARYRELSAAIRTTNQKLHRLQQYDEHILSIVKQSNRQAFEIYHWIVKNKDKFEEPNEIFFIPLVVNIKNPLHAIYFESTVSKNYQYGFVTTSIHDRDLIQNQIKERNYQLTVLRVSGSPPRNENRYSKEELARFGLTDYLDQVIQAPKEVMSALCDVSSIHYVLFTEKANLKIEDIGAHLSQARTVFEPQFRHFIAPSRYSNDLSIRSDRLNTSARLFKGIDKDEFEQLKKEKDKLIAKMASIQQSKEELSSKLHALDIKLAEVKNQRREVTQFLSEREKAKRSIERYEREVKRLSKEENIDEIKKKFRKEMLVYNEKRVKALQAIKDELTELFKLDFSTDIFPILKSKLRDEEIMVTQEKNLLLDEKTRITEKFRKVAKDFKDLCNELVNTKDHAIAAKEKYMEIHGISEEEIKAILNELPSELEEIRERIVYEETTANSIVSNQNVIREYEKRKIDIEKHERELTEFIQENDSMESIIKNIEQEWVTPLQACVQKLNETFQQYTRDFGIAGEVSLKSHPTDYSKWEIQIKVKFRDNEPLSVLSKNRQSGGERSVTTILYLLALQVINKSPFRVVDEINQGMDPINERKIFLQMLKSCQGRDVPQSFLVTPKLLPDLVPPDANNITILFIFNGPFGLSSSNWAQHVKKIGLSHSNELSATTESDESESD